jgi:hypothetical protein
MGIQQAVGQGSPNRYDDVKLIQGLLNKAIKKSVSLKAELALLQEDGICKEKTINAIHQFQRRIMLFQRTDGIVEPDRNTWKRLNNNATSTQAVRSSRSAQKPTVDNFLGWFERQMSPTPNKLIATPLSTPVQHAGKTAVPQNKSAQQKPNVTAYSQGDPRWGDKKVGNAVKPNKNFQLQGCAVVCLTMAATYLGSPTRHWPSNLNPIDLDPLAAHDIMKKAGAFLQGSASITLTTGAIALGMKASDSGKETRLTKSAIENIDAVLRNQGLIIAHVDYDNDGVGNHWVLLTQKSSTGEYEAIDPNGGRVIKFSISPTQGSSTTGAILYGQAHPNVSRAKDYRVVRYVAVNSN